MSYGGAQATADNGLLADAKRMRPCAPANLRVLVADEPMSGSAFADPNRRDSVHPWAVRFSPSDRPEPVLPNGRGRRATVERICKNCGVVFLARSSEVKRGKGVLCSRACVKSAPRAEKPPTVQLRTLEPGTRFRVETTEAEVVRQHRVMRETVVRYLRNSKTPVQSVWPNSVNVRVL